MNLQDRYAPPTASLVDATAAPPGRLFGYGAVGIAAFFGLPFAAGYLIYRNLRELGQRDKARKVFAGFIAGGALALYVEWHIPADFISYMVGVGLPQLPIALVAARLVQGRSIATHRSAGGQFRSTWVALGVGIAAKLAAEALLAAVVLVQRLGASYVFGG